MSPSKKFPLSRAALAVAIMGVAAFYAVVTLTEWWPILARDTVHVATYHFGSKSTMGHGGWKYANPEVYAWTSFAEGLAAIATLPMLWLTIVRRSRKAATALAIVCAIYAGASLILGQIHWSRREVLLRSKVTTEALSPSSRWVQPKRPIHRETMLTASAAFGSVRASRSRLHFAWTS
jgi:hypothetical protein